MSQGMIFAPFVHAEFGNVPAMSRPAAQCDWIVCHHCNNGLFLKRKRNEKLSCLKWLIYINIKVHFISIYFQSHPEVGRGYHLLTLSPRFKCREKCDIQNLILSRHIWHDYISSHYFNV